jgi:rhamnosyltransferase
MDETLFIDHVDTEWCLRAKARGFAIFATRQAVLRSSLGDRTFRFWFGRWRYAPLHSPIRHYYMLRNSILLMLRGDMPSAWKLYAARQAFATFLFYSLFGTERFQHWLSMTRGIRDGLKNRSGPLG